MTSRSDRMPALDLLRFFAATSVVAYHYVSSYLPDGVAGIWKSAAAVTRYGYLGVDIFFVISGFVILWTARYRTPSQFVISRISRLYPTFWVSMLLTSAAIIALGPIVPNTHISAITFPQLAANATMLPAVFGVASIDDVYWTLEVEIRFYFLIFVLLVTGLLQRIDAVLCFWLAVSAAGMFLDLPWIVDFLSLQPYGPFFIGGCVLYLIRADGLSSGRKAILAASAVLSMWSAFEGRQDFISPDAVSAIVVPGLVLLFFAVFFLVIRSTSALVAPGLAYSLGALTYPLYLTHAVIGRMVMDLLFPTVGVTGAVLITTLLALLVAQVLVWTVDVPARRPTTRICNAIWGRMAGAVK